MKTIISIIAAFDQNRGVGINNTLPWNFSKDLIRFRSITQNNPIVMGRKTFESINKPLPNRINIVLTRDEKWAFEIRKKHKELIVIFSWEDLETWIDEFEPERLYIIGGPQIWKIALPYIHQLLLTEIKSTYKCDAFFPEIDMKEWIQTDSLDYEEFVFKNYLKKEILVNKKQKSISANSHIVNICDLMDITNSDKLSESEKIRFGKIKPDADLYIARKKNQALKDLGDIIFISNCQEEKDWFKERFPQY